MAPESNKEAELIRAIHKDEFSLEAYCAALQAPRLKGNVREWTSSQDCVTLSPQDVATVLTQRWRQPNLSISAIEGSGTSSRVISRRATAKLSIST